jgi:hypothetical protein
VAGVGTTKTGYVIRFKDHQSAETARTNTEWLEELGNGTKLVRPRHGVVVHRVPTVDFSLLSRPVKPLRVPSSSGWINMVKLNHLDCLPDNPGRQFVLGLVELDKGKIDISLRSFIGCVHYCGLILCRRGICKTSSEDLTSFDIR